MVNIGKSGEQEAIVVGIDFNKFTRDDEMYLLNDDGKLATTEYIEFIVNTVKPYIDDNYNTLSDKENTTIAGASLGGSVSLYMAINYPTIFGNALCFSSTWDYVKDEDILNMLSNINYSDEYELPNIYLYSGRSGTY